MYDRVAEVLAERATLDRGAAAGLALSVALHAGATVAIVYAALHHPAPEMANVLLIKIAQPAPIAPSVSIPAAPPKPTPVAPKPAPVAVPAPVPPKNTAPPDTFGKSTKKPAEIPLPVEIPQPVPIPQPAQAQPSHPGGEQPGFAKTTDIAPGTSAVTGIEGGDFPYTIYIDRMKNLVGNKWYRPTGVTATATVHFVINRDGSIRDVTLETPSGNGAFDRATLRAVTEASPLPPLPFAYSGNYLGVHLTFR